MHLVFPSKRRNSLVISVAILKAARKGARKTHLIGLISLSNGQFVRYVEFLKAIGFIEECDKLYRTTDEGLKVIEEFDASSFMRSFLAA
jgi:predicted transcriptional regulator